MNRILFLFFFLSTSFAARAVQDMMQVSIYSDYTVHSYIFSPVIGSYEVIGDGDLIGTIAKNEIAEVHQDNGKIFVHLPGGKSFPFTSIHFKRREWGSVFRIKPISPQLSERTYYDHLLSEAKGKKIRLVNQVYLEYYTSGVVESEAGPRQSLEFYKVQAIICRTYALANMRRHEAEGFHLCDRVHCQVYKNRSIHNAEIPKATFATKGLVLVDTDIKLINASFHSNCGGQTSNSEDVWKYPLPYLKSVCDTFCSAQPHANWEKRIPLADWFGYIESKHGYTINDSVYFSPITDFVPTERQCYLIQSDSVGHLREIRTDLKLQSTYFSVQLASDTVLLRGNGFGHGVGLCQEGAMKMAEYGIPFNDILHYYYTNVHLIDLSGLNFFRQE